MLIHIENAKSNAVGGLRDSKVHSIPCKIFADCEANVSEFFETTVKTETDNTLSAGFRGYPLFGTSLDLPEGYVGFVLHESIAPLSDKQERRFHIINKFNSLHYWHWDKAPSQNDKIVQALEWIEVAEALHSPIVEE